MLSREMSLRSPTAVGRDPALGRGPAAAARSGTDRRSTAANDTDNSSSHAERFQGRPHRADQCGPRAVRFEPTARRREARPTHGRPSTEIHPEARGVCREQSRCRSGGIPLSPLFGGEIEHHQPRVPGCPRWLSHVRQPPVGEHAGEPGSGTERSIRPGDRCMV